MPTPITDIDADIIFIIDSSSDVTPENYVREKSLVKDMARYLNVSTGGSRAALIAKQLHDNCTDRVRKKIKLNG